MEVTVNTKRFDDRKKIVLKKLIEYIKSGDEDIDTSYRSRSNLVFSSLGKEIDKSNYRFIYKQYINEKVISFLYSRKISDDESVYFIGFTGLSSVEMEMLDLSFNENETEYIEKLKREDENISLYCKAIADLDLSIVKSTKKGYIINNIVAEDIEKVDFRSVSECFGEFYSIQLKKECEIETEDIFFEYLIKIFLDSKILINKDLINEVTDSDTENLFYELLDIKEINKYHILSGLLSQRFEDTFLSYYKILESLFPIFYYHELHQSLKKSGKKIHELAIVLEKQANVRASESESLKRIFDFYNEKNCLDDLVEIFEVNEISDESKKIETIANCFYQIRNSYVHGRWIFTTKQAENKKNFNTLDKQDWIKLIKIELKILDVCLKYAKNSNYI